jgi:CRP-like cAMP-binding protein
MPGFLNHGRKGSSRRSSRGSLNFSRGRRLYELDRPATRVYLLLSGQVQLTSGRGAIVDYLGKEDFFGEKAFIQPQARVQLAKSISAVEVRAFSKSELLDCLQHDRRFAARLLKNLALRLDRYEQAIEDFVAESAERRLARLLSRFLPPRGTSGWVPLRFSPSNPELAKTIRSTRWRVAHFMRQFQRSGWLERRPELWVRCEGLREFLESTARKM